MARFRKVIATAGKYTVANERGGRHETELTMDRFRNWVMNHAKLKSKGYKVPTPFVHDMKNGVPVEVGPDGVPDALKNAGFIEDLSAEVINGVPSLVGVFDIPGDSQDPNSLAYKVGKTVKETSVYVRPGFLDGKGETYTGEVPMHVALITNPIEPGQQNFELIGSGNDLAIAMSQKVVMGNGGNLSPQIGDTEDEKPEDEDEGFEPVTDSGETASTGGDSLIAQLIKVLRNPTINIDLPDDTNEGNFAERLNVAARQRAKQPAQPPVAQPAPPAPPPGQQPQGQQPPNQPGQPGKPVSLVKPPRNAVEQPASLAMSQDVNQTAEQKLAVVMSQLAGYESANKILSGYVTALEKEKRAHRIAALVASGRVTQDYADKHLQPSLEGFQMSLGADGNPAPAAIDTLLVALEAMPAKTGSVAATMVSLPASAFSNLPPEAQNAVATVLMNMGGAIPAGAREETHPQAGFFDKAEIVDETKGKEVANQFLANVR